MKVILNKGRSSLIEGSFGNEKNHYCLRKIKEKSKETELIWLSMGVMTANAVKIAKRRKRRKQEDGSLRSTSYPQKATEKQEDKTYTQKMRKRTKKIKQEKP